MLRVGPAAVEHDSPALSPTVMPTPVGIRDFLVSRVQVVDADLCRHDGETATEWSQIPTVGRSQ